MSRQQCRGYMPKPDFLSNWWAGHESMHSMDPLDSMDSWIPWMDSMDPLDGFHGSLGFHGLHASHGLHAFHGFTPTLTPTPCPRKTARSAPRSWHPNTYTPIPTPMSGLTKLSAQAQDINPEINQTLNPSTSYTNK